MRVKYVVRPITGKKNKPDGRMYVLNVCCCDGWWTSLILLLLYVLLSIYTASKQCYYCSYTAVPGITSMYVYTLQKKDRSLPFVRRGCCHVFLRKTPAPSSDNRSRMPFTFIFSLQIRRCSKNSRSPRRRKFIAVVRFIAVCVGCWISHATFFVEELRTTWYTAVPGISTADSALYHTWCVRT